MKKTNNIEEKQDDKKTLLITRIYNKINLIKEIVNQPTLFPEYERKSKLRRYIDNYKWTLKYRRVNTCYNIWGLDAKNFRNPKDYLDLKDMRKQKNEIGINLPEDSKITPQELITKFSLIADDKFVFYTYFNSIMPGITPDILMIFKNNKVLWPDTNKTAVEYIKDLKDEKYICKANTGLGGHSITLITKKNNKITLSREDTNLEEFIESLGNDTYIIQNYVYQHKDIAKLNESSLNTVRIISVRFNEKTSFLGAMLRIGVDKNQVVDNASSGGTFVGIDIETGKLKEYGHFFDGEKTKSHPSSKITYKDYQIPYWKEVKDLIKKLHPFMYGMPSIGWDIAITEKGPVIIEINADWGTKGLQTANGGLKARWEELKKK